MRYRQLESQIATNSPGYGVQNEPVIRRVVVALDASPHSQAALQTAARLAARLGARLEGLFVEDIDLLRMADTPIAREIGYFSASVRQLSSVTMERQLRAVARRIRHMLAQAALQAEIDWSFRVLRGKIGEELLAAITETDLLRLGRLGWALTQRASLGSTAQIVLQNQRSPILLMNANIQFSQPIVVLFDGSERSTRALDMAAHLVKIHGSELIVLVPGAEFVNAQRLREEAIKRLSQHYVSAGFQRIASVECSELLRILRYVRCSMLILAQRYFPQLDSLTCAVLLIP